MTVASDSDPKKAGNVAPVSSPSNRPSPVPEQQNPASKKLQKILDSRFETDKEAIGAMQSLSELMDENTITARRNLRSDLERRNLRTSKEFLVQFKKVRDQLNTLAGVVTDISSCCSSMQDELKRTKESTSALMERTNELNDEASLLAMQQTLTDVFCRRFYLLPEEENVLKSNKDAASPEEIISVLKVLKKIRNIQKDAKILLRTKNQVTGLEIMERMGHLEEMGFEKLYRWTQRECRNMSAESPDISSLVVDALQALSERKTLLNYAMDEFSVVRKGVVSRGFIDALTRGTGGVKPIEMHAHDPVRYIGDMLAWIHQALASEREYVQMLVQKTDMTKEEINFFVAFSSEGLCRPLKVRLDHIIANDPDAITMYRIRGLLKFYYSTFSDSISPTSPLCSAMMENAGLFDKLFFSTLKTSLNALCDSRDPVPTDLSPSNSVMKIMTVLQQILHSQSNNFSHPQSKQQDFKHIVDTLTGSLMQCLQQSGSTLSSPADMAVFMMNCLNKAKSTLAVYEFTDEKVEMLSAQIDAHLDTLVNEQVRNFLFKTELLFAHNKFTSGDKVFTPSEVDRLKVAGNMLDKFLSHPDQFSLPQCRSILSATLREAAVTTSHAYFAQCYSQIVSHLEASNQAELLQVLRQPDQVQSLLN